MAFLSAIAVASIAWWVATGLVLALARAGSRHLGAVMALATGVALAGIAGLVATHDQTTVSSAYVAFFSALALWAWHETTFLIGTADRTTADRGRSGTGRDIAVPRSLSDGSRP
jgi:putative photosynthetic complex assembly protein 2